MEEEIEYKESAEGKCRLVVQTSCRISSISKVAVSRFEAEDFNVKEK